MAMIAYLLLMVVRPICLPVSEAVMVYWGNKRIGVLASYLLGVVGAVTGLMILFVLAEHLRGYLSRRKKIAGKLASFQEMASGHVKQAVAAMLVIPVLPDTVICIGAAALKLPRKTFFFLILVGKTLSIGMVEYSQRLAGLLSLEGWQLLLMEVLAMYAIAMLWKHKKEEEKHHWITIQAPYQKR